MATPVTPITAQFFHQTTEPLDKSAEVDTPDKLYNTEYVVPYVGKMVHVKSLQAIYVCAEKTGGATTAVWRPVMADDGSGFFITTPAGEVFRISANRLGDQGRILVDIPAAGIRVITYDTVNQQ